jgi:chitinase
MSFRSKALPLLGALVLFCFSLHVHAQTADCTGVNPWNATTLYNPAQKVVFQGSLYQTNVQLANVSPNYCPTCNWYTLLGACSTGGGGGGTPPTVSITAPGNGASFACGASVPLSATAVSTSSTIANVEFFDGGALIATDTSSPFTATWVPTTSGSHQLTAVTTDSISKTGTSSTVTVTIGACGGGGGNNSPLPVHALIGYWHNFDNGSGFIKLRDVSPDWDVIDLAFGEPVGGSSSQIGFTPDTRTSVAEVQSDVQILHSRGKKVLLSIGGANGHVELDTAAQQKEFVDSVTGIIRQYGLDGIDIDFEGSSVHLNGGDNDLAHPTTPLVVNLIAALHQLHNTFGPNFILTMAPETFFVQIGFQVYGGSAGAYLPVINNVRDILTVLHVQDYNAGSALALDNQIYNQATPDFHVAMTEMLITGFPVAGINQTFAGLRPDQVAIGLPANTNAGNGWTPVPQVQQALSYLILGKSFGGKYVLRNPAGYRSLRGLMSWSINWDRFASFDFSHNHRQFLNALPPP